MSRSNEFPRRRIRKPKWLVGRTPWTQEDYIARVICALAMHFGTDHVFGVINQLTEWGEFKEIAKFRNQEQKAFNEEKRKAHEQQAAFKAEVAALVARAEQHAYRHGGDAIAALNQTLPNTEKPHGSSRSHD